MGTNVLQVQVPDLLWVVKPCNTTGCSVLIRTTRAESASVLNCRWCQANADYNTDGSQVHPVLVNGPRMSKDEFGVNLFETIKTISSLHTLRRQLNHAVHVGHRVKEITSRYKEAQGYLANQLPTLTDHEMAQVLEQYPSVVAM